MIRSRPLIGRPPSPHHHHMVGKEGWPMRGRDLVMWSEGQWEASKKTAWEGDKHTNKHTDKRTSRLLERIGLRADSLKSVINKSSILTGDIDMFVRRPMCGSYDVLYRRCLRQGVTYNSFFENNCNIAKQSYHLFRKLSWLLHPMLDKSFQMWPSNHSISTSSPPLRHPHLRSL